MGRLLSGTVRCQTLYHEEIDFPVERLIMRPSVYGIVVHQDHILLAGVRSTGRLIVPGGAVELGERLEDALRREVREETGVQIGQVEFATFTERFFYYDPLDLGMQVLAFFYLCQPLTFDIAPEEKIDDGEATQPRWVPLKHLRRDDLQSFADEVFGILRL